MLKLLSENRLKIASFLACSADVTMAIAGGESFLSPDKISSAAGLLLFISGVLATIGHGALFLWGKGGRLEKIQRSNAAKTIPIYLKPLKPWHYPLDFSFLLWFCNSLMVLVAGIISANIGLFGMGCFTATAAAIGWLWPAYKPLFGLRSMQVTALLYASASVSGFVGAIISHNWIIFAAMCMYLSCNIILYTVKKENQSAHTQSQQV